MSNPDLPYALAYKLACLLSGVISAYLGYLLFVKGYIEPAGDASGEWKGVKVVIKRAAPGTFFSIVAGFVLCFTVAKGMKSTIEGVPLEIINNKLDLLLKKQPLYDSIPSQYYRFMMELGADSNTTDSIWKTFLKTDTSHWPK